MQKKSDTPTPAELEILNILWIKEPLSVKEINEQLSKQKEVGYTTTLKIMQNMYAKGLLSRKLSGKLHLYRPKFKQEETQRSMLDRFIESAFSGSATSLVMQLLGNKQTSKEELEEIKNIIRQLDSEDKI